MRTALLAALGLAAAAAGATAAAPPEPPVYRLEVHFLQAGRAAQYEAAVHGLVAALGAAAVRRPTWDFAVGSDGGSTYVTICPLQNWAAMDSFAGDGEVVARQLGPQMAAFSQGVRAALAREDDLYVQTTPNPADPGALGENGRNFLLVDLCYATPGAHAYATVKSIQELRRTAQPGLSCRLYGAVSGDDLPLILLVRAASDRAGLAAADAALPAGPQAALAQLRAELRRRCRRLATMEFTVRPDLSYRIPAGP